MELRDNRPGSYSNVATPLLALRSPPCGRMTRTLHKAARFEARILEGLREVGVLLIAFAPLESALRSNETSHPARFLVGFLGAGLLLFGLALLPEWRVNHVA